MGSGILTSGWLRTEPDGEGAAGYLLLSQHFRVGTRMFQVLVKYYTTFQARTTLVAENFTT